MNLLSSPDSTLVSKFFTFSWEYPALNEYARESEPCRWQPSHALQLRSGRPAARLTLQRSSIGRRSCDLNTGPNLAGSGYGPATDRVSRAFSGR